MNCGRLLAQASLWLAGLLLGAPPVQCHEFALESVMNGFVKIESHEAHLVVRVPLHVLKTAAFPATGREIDLIRAEPAAQRALALLGREITLRENGRPLVASAAAGRLSLPSDRSFENYQQALNHVAEPVPAGTVIYYDQGYFDAHLTYPIASPDSLFTIQTAVAPELKDYLRLAVRYLARSNETRALLITSRTGEVALNPTWLDAARGFIALGMAHIFTGADHLLFLLCLIIPLRGWREILAIVTAFTVAHSITLIGSAYNVGPQGAWFPPLVETLIAASIVYMALENIVGVSVRRRLLLTGLFGLAHGFGFSYGLKENLQFAGSHALVSLFSFNVGIELGQLMVLAFMLPALMLARRFVLAGAVGMIVLSALVAHTGWHWLTERADVLWKTDWPRPDASDLATLARWFALLLVLGAGIAFMGKQLKVANRASASLLGLLAVNGRQSKDD
jgi:hypothetical protein